MHINIPLHKHVFTLLNKNSLLTWGLSVRNKILCDCKDFTVRPSDKQPHDSDTEQFVNVPHVWSTESCTA